MILFSRHVCHKWHYKITKAMVVCLDSRDYVQIRNSLIVLIRILPHFPVLAKLSQIIERKIEKVCITSYLTFIHNSYGLMLWQYLYLLYKKSFAHVYYFLSCSHDEQLLYPTETIFLIYNCLNITMVSLAYIIQCGVWKLTFLKGNKIKFNTDLWVFII